MYVGNTSWCDEMIVLGYFKPFFKLANFLLKSFSKPTLTFTPTQAIFINSHATQAKPFSQPHNINLITVNNWIDINTRK